MIQVALLPLLVLYLSKDSMFLSSLSTIDKNLFGLIFIFPLIFFLVSVCAFPFSGRLERKLYMTIFALLSISLFFCFVSSTALVFFISVELCVFVIIILIFRFAKDSDKFSSVSFIFIINSLGSMPFMYFCSFSKILLCRIETSIVSHSSFWGMIFCFTILATKIPVFFVHFWLTKAHVRASGTGSIILARFLLKLGTLGAYKFCFFFTYFSKKLIFPLLCSIAIFGCLALGVVIARFFDLKYLVACSSITHISFILPSSFCPGPVAILGSLIMIVRHGLTSGFIFFLVRVIYEASLNRSSDGGKGVERSRAIFTIILYIFFLFNLGFPPFVRFFAEFAILIFLTKHSLFFSFFFCFSLMELGLVFIFIILTFLFGKNSKKWLGQLDGLVASRFSFFIFVFFSLILVFN